MADVQVPLPIPAPFSQAPNFTTSEVSEQAETSGASADTTPVTEEGDEPAASTSEVERDVQSAEPTEEVATVVEPPVTPPGTLSPDSEAPTMVIEEATIDGEEPQPEDMDSTSELSLILGDFPFWDEDELDPGTPFTGSYICWDPGMVPIDMGFPFQDVPMEDIDALREVVPGANVSKLLPKYAQEYYRNYLRGHTLKQLRTSTNYKPVVPGALQKLLDLPLELLFDILELVHPMDLLHLSRATQGMKAVLTTTRAREVWLASYRNHAETITSLNPNVPPLKWTAMLYTSAICDFCGRKGALMDFALEAHYCEPCQRVLLKDRNDLRPLLTDRSREAEDIFDLLIPTYRQCGERYHTSYEATDNARYRVKDFEAMLKELQEWYMTIDEGVISDAGEKFEAWKQSKRHEIDIRNMYAQQANNWAMNISYAQAGEVYEKQQKSTKKIAKRLIRMGHDPRDVECADPDIFYLLRYNNLLKMKTPVFEHFKGELINRVDAHKRNRFRKERREQAIEAYDTYKKTLKPERWQYMLPLEIVLYQEPFHSFQNSLDEGAELTPEVVKEKLPATIEEWIGERRLEQYQMIPGHEMPEVEPETEEGLSDEDRATRAQARELVQKEILSVLMDQRMNLATSVFSCTSCKSGRHSAMALVGWEATLAHMCGSLSSWYHSSFEFCSVGYAAAANIIRSVGLNPETATPVEVDAIDARFFCLNCPVTLHRKVRGRKAYTWRECVQHAVEKEEDHGHAVPSWTRLSTEATAFVKAHETPAPVFRKGNWGCNHCPEHYTPAHRKEVIEHVKTAHSIETPVQGVDFLDFKHRYELGGNYRRRHIFHFGVEPTCNLVCKICPSGKLKKMWTTLNLIPHLFHKHGISMPSSARDYYKIPIFHGD